MSKQKRKEKAMEVDKALEKEGLNNQSIAKEDFISEIKESLGISLQKIAEVLQCQEDDLERIRDQNGMLLLRLEKAKNLKDTSRAKLRKSKGKVKGCEQKIKNQQKRFK